jgi:hypothetical protein
MLRHILKKIVFSFVPRMTQFFCAFYQVRL